MERDPVRMGVAGCGWIAGTVHLPLLSRMPGADLVAVCDTDPARLATAMERIHGARGYDRPEALFDHPGLEAVVIATPTATHAELAVAAFERGLHVYLEKPVATSADDAERVLGAWRAAGTIGVTGLNYRLNPSYEELRRAVADGRIGRPILVRSAFAHPPASRPGWREARASGGGALLDLASHHVDLVRRVTGQEIESVRARVWSERAGEDSAIVEATLSDGARGQGFFSRASVEEDVLEVYGERGKLTVDRYLRLRPKERGLGHHRARLEDLVGALGSVLPRPRLLRKLRAPLHEPSFRIALEDFLAAVRGQEPRGADLAEGARCLAVVLAAEASAREGATVACGIGT